MSSLRGLKFLNTRAGHQANSLTYEIERRGGISIEIPLIAIQPPENIQQRNKELMRIMKSDWLIFTSVNSFHYTCEALEECGFEVSKVIGSKKVAVVGEKTKEIVGEYGFYVDVCPEEKFDAEHLAVSLINASHSTDSFFYPRSSQSRKVLVDTLLDSGRFVYEMVAYETVMNDQYQTKLNHLLKNNELDIVLVTSPSIVHSFFKQVDENVISSIKEKIMFVAIGRVTAEALSRYDILKVLVPDNYTIESMLDIVEEEQADI
ncbi:uroporphyrinogen-III synthase [Salipaludibacillus daqingensis]|uniref:uroporphyrinogen-III synthase n=1 Tax=Salipaludibacillus daqingensis TaxID=3041001 RepID=UPI002475356D|nr:uroporphyrinogen-III synthase [Salipaludibacillus daqingensis]